jgi:NADH-quinone oxidoreductase subunit L
LRRPAAAEFGYDVAMVRGVEAVTDTAVQVVASTEADVVEPYARGGDAGAQWGSRLVRWLHDGNLQHYVTAVVVGAVAVAVIIGVVTS